MSNRVSSTQRGAANSNGWACTTWVSRGEWRIRSAIAAVSTSYPGSGPSMIASAPIARLMWGRRFQPPGNWPPSPSTAPWPKTSDVAVTPSLSAVVDRTASAVSPQTGVSWR